jgi:predicted KAP-like P-loop ATPase
MQEGQAGYAGASVTLSSDVPVEKPHQDEFGYWPFAQALSRAIRTTPSPRGLVMSLNGPWGSGKSSLVNLIRHDLATLHVDAAPLVLEFNPWWFSGSDQLAIQLLTQLYLRLKVDGSEPLRKIGDLMGQYSGELAKAVSTATAMPLLEKPIQFLLKKLKRPPADVRTMKVKLAQALSELGQRILIVVDDIDRLTPPEMLEVFKVVKALGDFPNVVYLLVFDWTVVASGLHHELRNDGTAYLEKIIQSPFALPAVSQMQLDRKFQVALGVLIDRLPHYPVSRTYFGNVYLEGLQQYLRNARDVVRIINVLEVTYPAVAGEVNSVDFVALEFLRIFEPIAYDTLRDNIEMFTGNLRELQGERDRLRLFHETWLALIDGGRRPGIRALMTRMFPKVETSLGGMTYDADWALTWRQEKRLCSQELAPVYFAFGVPSYVLSEAEAIRVMESAGDTELFVATWGAARGVIRPDGHSKAADLLNHLQHLPDSTDGDTAIQLLRGVLAVTGDVLTAGDEDGSLGLGGSLRVDFALRRLIRLIPESQRVQAVRVAIQGSRALAAASSMIETLEALRNRGERQLPAGISAEDVTGFQQLLLGRFRDARLEDLLNESGLPQILYRWTVWGAPDEAREKFAPALDNPDQLAALVERCARDARIQVVGDRLSRLQLRFDVELMRLIVDDAAARAKLEELLARTDLSDRQREATELYLRAIQDNGRNEAGRRRGGGPNAALERHDAQPQAPTP